MQSIQYLPISDIKPHPLNASIYGDGADKDLFESVKKIGIMSPIVVTKSLLIISGHRRFNAAQMAGLSEIPCVISEVDETDQLTVEELLIEANVQRQKKPEQIAREYIKLKEIEEEKAKKRILAGKSHPGENFPQGEKVESDPQENFPEGKGKSRDIAAKKLGISGKTAEHSAKVVSFIDSLRSEGKYEEAEALRQTLNQKSVNAAYQQIKPKKEDPKEKQIISPETCLWQRMDDGKPIFAFVAKLPNWGGWRMVERINVNEYKFVSGPEEDYDYDVFHHEQSKAYNKLEEYATQKMGDGDKELMEFVENKEFRSLMIKKINSELNLGYYENFEKESEFEEEETEESENFKEKKQPAQEATDTTPEQPTPTREYDSEEEYLEAHCHELEDALEDSQKENAKLEEENKRLGSQIRLQNQTIANLQINLKKYTDAKMREEHFPGKIEEESRRVAEENRKLKEKIAVLEAENAKLKEETEKDKEYLGITKEEIAHLQEKLSKKIDLLERLKEENAKLKEERPIISDTNFTSADIKSKDINPAEIEEKEIWYSKKGVQYWFENRDNVWVIIKKEDKEEIVWNTFETKEKAQSKMKKTIISNYLSRTEAPSIPETNDENAKLEPDSASQESKTIQELEFDNMVLKHQVEDLTLKCEEQRITMSEVMERNVELNEKVLAREARRRR